MPTLLSCSCPPARVRPRPARAHARPSTRVRPRVDPADEEEEDVVDSDFDISETDEPIDTEEADAAAIAAKAAAATERRRARAAAVAGAHGDGASAAPKQRPKAVRPKAEALPLRPVSDASAAQLDVLGSLINAAAAGIDVPAATSPTKASKKGRKVPRRTLLPQPRYRTQRRSDPLTRLGRPLMHLAQ